MSGATVTTYEWLYDEFTDGLGEPWLHAGFVHGLHPEDAMQRIGITPGPLDEAGSGVTAYAAHGGTVLLERCGEGIVYGNAHLLSEGTAAAAVRVTLKGEDFIYYVKDQLITTFSLFSYRFREDSDPDRLRSDLQELGMNLDDERPEFPEHPVASALALAERATGVHLSPAHYADPALTGTTGYMDRYR
ncbi:DUF6461 domain-containing protein [Nonomuraea sp. LP-02]|uniref:DUF6461 domain-containing protein n=1 Tax=Nonomuraea sp. LP-02 TaxID=3097960 RepID=UPI002E378A67|nr:DUF6461 domain-containing protein [Nonomuraea sp. LP-02]MED7928691.1 DUF6461 domain-containing protein [Nonomuraea sp. LP-02]